ncbi:hypothetical protein ABMA28_005599 [Loxostege sticticalis]|uniref:DUF7041 domain-containing protein n=1 Tax=Loxostege sticticalis TaxID=481309 RepID=A0ABD0SM66_LOXSC
MADQELQARLRQLEQENAALQERLARSGSIAEPQHSPLPSPSLSVSRVAVKLPPFWADRPAIWFSQAEAQFDIAGITSDATKYNYIISQLDQRLALEVEDIITNPPKTEERYTKLKQELIRRLSMSEEQRVRQLISEEELGDRRPSQFLRHLRSLAGAALSDDNILRQLWMRRLPTPVQAILASQAELSLDKIADLADKVSEVTTSHHQVFACTTPAAPTSVLEKLVSQVEELQLQVAALSSDQRGRPRYRSNSRQSRDGTPSTKWCWYHRKFNAKATRCTQPCSWNQENSKDSQ